VKSPLGVHSLLLHLSNIFDANTLIIPMQDSVLTPAFKMINN